VPRALFGQEKKAPTQPFNPARGNAALDGRPLADLLGEGSLREFRQFLATRVRPPGRAARAGFALRRALFRVRPPVPEWLRPWLRRPAVDRLRAVVQDGRFEFPVREHDFLFHWAMERTMRRYLAPPAAASSGTT